jgi:hypothetical protein
MRTGYDEENSRQYALLIFDFRFFSWINFPPAPVFSKKFEMTLMLLSEAWGKMIHEKTRSKKSCDIVPLGVLNNFIFIVESAAA